MYIFNDKWTQEYSLCFWTKTCSFSSVNLILHCSPPAFSIPTHAQKSPNHYLRKHVNIFKGISPHIHTLAILCDEGYSLSDDALWHQDHHVRTAHIFRRSTWMRSVHLTVVLWSHCCSLFCQPWITWVTLTCSQWCVCERRTLRAFLHCSLSSLFKPCA